MSAAVHGVVLLVLLSLRVSSRVPEWARSSPPFNSVAELLAAFPGVGNDRSLPGPAPGQIPADFGERLDVGQLTIDLSRVRERRTNLFPFLTLDLKFLDPLTEQVIAARQRLTNPYAASRVEGRKPLLEMTDAVLQQTIDTAWSRRNRWQRFAPIAELLQTHDAQDGRSADVMRGYLDQNLLQPFCDGVTRDARFWAMLENAADHADFIDFVRSFARQYPSSRTTTELLFLLDELAQASRDVAMMLIDTRPEKDLPDTTTLAPEASALARELKQYYGRWLFDRGLDKEALGRAYDDRRLRILDTIVETTPNGYRAGDARYLAGEILFNAGRNDDAYRRWLAIQPDSRDAYYRAYSEIRRILETTAVNPTEVRRALRNEYGRWRVYSIDRLRQFGYACDIF